MTDEQKEETKEKRKEYYERNRCDRQRRKNHWKVYEWMV